jgi:hypothetical protein
MTVPLVSSMCHSATRPVCVELGWTIAVALDVAAAEPAELLAVTATRRVPPTSAATTTYVGLVAPAMSPHPAPVESQRRH